ncbi:DUF305 domain-containing protein [Noviherbaspirillum aridicola]|uniref:DUF305 domain-containing protein n=1 Tax=Noviherbaspirillum aridicola TaxID=2849687 RepID=A0ABQ4Q897_9BURK|nr:DUF305 domain-containing protein [Noviherbaspirillum aridicola]GIZ53297.1 hypothetical protein NCCP691_33110 [Noviherbaspirillum aridicola]
MRVSHLTSIALVSLALAGPVFAQGGHAGMHGDAHGGKGPMSHDTMKSSPNAARAAFDHQFIDTMIVHHQSAIDMAQLVDKRAGHDELKQMARKMMDDQQREISQLQDWKQQWYAGKGDAVNMAMPGMAESMKGMPMEKMASASGADFEALFIDAMVRHHRGAVRMAELAQKKAGHPELKKMSQDIIREQKKEIADMLKWKKEWKLTKK